MSRLFGRLFGRKKKEEEKEEEPEPSPAEIQESALRRKCREHGRPDLYDPLSKTILAEPRGRDVESLLSEGTYSGCSAAASVMLYERNPELAKEYFEKTIELGTPRKESYSLVIEDIDIVAKIVTDWYKDEGKYKELEKKKK